jgi:hypothetical protein
MDGCSACEEARTVAHSGMFRAGCRGCIARAVSRGVNFHDSRKAEKQTARYRMELEQFGVTHREVLDAWKQDAANASATA